ncbi:MAG: 4-hydroxy-tetrahydrodipicolinate synthase [Chitinophagales bacterium]|nr:4-hydroxy-tetrahydrodipicolinate synthase [Chitinophagales bacterium]
MQWKGTGVALVTPFDSKKKIDFKSLAKVIDHCIDGGVNYLVSLGTTGETVVLSLEEKQEILNFTKEHVNGRVPLVAGFGGNNTQFIVDKINSFQLEGYSAILSSSPNYNKPTQEGIYQHYKYIAQNTPLPIILYNVPGRTAQNMEAQTTLRLAHDFSNIVAVKEASNNLLQCMEIVKDMPSNFQLLSGDDVHALPMFSFGCTGVISVIAQGIPKSFTSMVNFALEGKFQEASKEQFKFLELIKLIFKENNPAGIKAVLEQLGLCENELRLPLVPISKALYSEIAEQVKSLR